MTAVKLDKNAARDIWAAELRNGAEAFNRFGPVTGNLVAVLKGLHESVDGGADDPLGFFLSEPGEESLFEAKQVDGVHTGKTAKLVGESFGSELLVFLLQRAPITDPRILQVVAKFLIELFNVEFSAEGKNDRPRLQAGNDDLGHLGGGE